MDFSKLWIPILVLTVIFFLRDRFPQKWERLRAPILMVCSVLTLLLVCVLLVAAYVIVFHRTVSAGEKSSTVLPSRCWPAFLPGSTLSAGIGGSGIAEKRSERFPQRRYKRGSGQCPALTAQAVDNPPAKGFGGKDSVKGNRQGSLSR